MRLGARLSVRARLLLAIGLLAVAVLTVGTIAWGALTRGSGQLERLHDETLEGVDRALTLSRQAADLATLAPWLLTLDSPWRIAQNGQTARDLADAIAAQLGPDDPLRAAMNDTSAAIADLVREVSLRAMLKDRTLRLDADLARAERRFAALAAQPGMQLPDRQDWLMLQRGAVNWSIARPQTTAALSLPLMIPQSAIVVASGLFVIYALRDLVVAARSLLGFQAPDTEEM